VDKNGMNSLQYLLRNLPLLLLFLLLTACGSEEPTPTPTATPAPAAPTATATTAPSALPSPTATVAVAPAPIVTATEMITASAVVTAALTDTNTVFLPETHNADGTCILQPDIDLAGFQNLEARMGCPVAEANFDDIGINEFGETSEAQPDYNRFMLWLSSEAQIYVLYPDQQWKTFADTWTEDQPTYACNPLGGEEDSPPLPRRGFGKLWCNEPGLIEVLGTIPREERLCQYTVLQRFERGRLIACYEDATIRYIRLLDDGTWDTLLTR